MNAGGGERPHGRVGVRESPVVFGQGKEFVLAEVALNLQHRTQGAAIDELTQRHHLGLKAALMPYAQHQAARLALGHGNLRVGQSETQRFFAKYM